LVSATVPVVQSVVRPHLVTDWPTVAPAVVVAGVPYPAGSVDTPRLPVVVAAIAASIVLQSGSFTPPVHAVELNVIAFHAASVPILSAGSLPPSTAPGWSAASPVLATLLFASTWLLLSAKTLPAAFLTRAPIVPAVTAGWPTDTPIGTGLLQRSDGFPVS
jgi:hypothetical protein